MTHLLRLDNEKTGKNDAFCIGISIPVFGFFNKDFSNIVMEISWQNSHFPVL